MPQSIHISIHIEATTGTSFLNDLGRIYGKDQVLLFDHHKEKVIRLSEVPFTPGQSLLYSGKKLLTKAPVIGKLFQDRDDQGDPSSGWMEMDEIPEDAAAIHGHFIPDRFEGQFQSTYYSIVIREPLERMILQYRQWKRNQGDVNWRVMVPYDQDLSFKEYAFLTEYQNYQSQYLGDKRLGDFDYVGVIEMLDIHLRQLQGENWSDIKITEQPVSYDRFLKDKKLDLTKDWIEKFIERNEKDYYIYRQAKEFINYG